MERDTSSAPRGSATLRLRMVGALRKTLEAVPRIETIVPDSEVAQIWDRGLPWSDLIIQALDLRLRVVLFPEQDKPDGLVTESNLALANQILTCWPETAAVALIANDQPELSTAIIEPYEMSGALSAPTGVSRAVRPTLGPGPAARIVQDYFHALSPSWSAVRSLEIGPTASLQAMVGDSVDEVWQRLSAEVRRMRTPLKQEGIESISEENLADVIDAVIRVLAGSEQRDPKIILDEFLRGEE